MYSKEKQTKDVVKCYRKRTKKGKKCKRKGKKDRNAKEEEKRRN